MTKFEQLTGAAVSHKLEVDNKKFTKLSNRIKYFKNSEEGVKEMCQIMDECKAEGRAEGIEETLYKILKIIPIDDIVNAGYDRDYLIQIANRI